jgi:hypothetical protein
MKKEIIAANLFWLILLPLFGAESPTAHGTIGMLDAQLVTKTLEPVGSVDIWNTPRALNLEITPADGYLLSKVYVFINPELPPPPVEEWEDPVEPNFGQWPYAVSYKKEPSAEPHFINVRFDEELDFEWGHWGHHWLEERLVTVGIRVELKSIGAVPVILTAWALNPHLQITGQRCGWGDNALAMRYEIQHPKHGIFSSGPMVRGLGFATRTQVGTTGDDSGFWYFPGEMMLFSIGKLEIGHAFAGQRLTPLDIFNSSEPGDVFVSDLARLLLSMDADGELDGTINIAPAIPFLNQAVDELWPDDSGQRRAVDFTLTGQMDALIGRTLELANAQGMGLTEVSTEYAVAMLEGATGDLATRRNVSKSPDYLTDKPKLDIMPMWVPARRADGTPATVPYFGNGGDVIEERNMVKPLFVTYTEEQEPNLEAGITRRASDIITAVSLDDGATWRRFNVSHMARRSSFALRETSERFPGNCRGPRQKIEGNKILVVWTSAYARGGKPSFSIRTDDAHTVDDAYAVTDYWGVRGRQGSVNYDDDDTVGDQGIGEVPYYALWSCRGIVDTSGEITWYKPERLTSGRRDAFYPVVSSANGAGFAITWQEDPGGLRPGQCLGGGEGWSGATVHKKTDIWYSYLRLSDFAAVDHDFLPGENGADDHGEDSHGQQPQIATRPKWLVPMSLPVRVSDNNTVNTENLRVELDAVTGLPLLDENGDFIPLLGAEEADFKSSEHETEGGCGDSDDGDHDHTDHDGQTGTGGGWGMARYAYMVPGLDLADKTGSTTFWNGTVDGEFRPQDSNARWYRFINKPGIAKTVVVTADGRVLDGDTGACRPNVKLVSAGGGKAWAILCYEETKGLGTPPEGDHEEDGETDHADRPEPEDSGKNVIYHSFPFNDPDMVSAGHVVNLPALDDDMNLIPIHYKDAEGNDTEHFRQYKTENARRGRFLAQSFGSMKKAGGDTIMLLLYKQGREGQGSPSDIFAVRVVVPQDEINTNTGKNPFRFENFQRLDTLVENPDANGRKRYRRLPMNLTSSTVAAVEAPETGDGDARGRVLGWGQYGPESDNDPDNPGRRNNLLDESFANPYSESKGHRGFIRGQEVVMGYSSAPNWGDQMDFYVRRSFDGGKSWTTKPGGNGTTHTVVEYDSATGHYRKRENHYGAGEFEPGRNVSLLDDLSYTVTDPRLVPPMGPTVFGSTPAGYLDDQPGFGIYYVAFGTARIILDPDDPSVVLGKEAADLFYTRTTDDGETWLQIPWVVNPDRECPEAEESVYHWPTLAGGTPHQGHSQLRMHPSGTRLYAIWHQWADGDDMHLTPHDYGDDIWFRRIDFMDTPQ